MKKVEDFKSLEEAVAWGNQVDQQRADAVKAQEDAEAAADEALAKLEAAEQRADKAEATAEQALKDAPKSYVKELPHIGRVKVRFGVNGLTKDQVLEEDDLLEHLVDIGSGAVEVLDEEGGAQ